MTNGYVIRVRDTNLLWPMIVGRPAWVGKDKVAAQNKLRREIPKESRDKYEVIPQDKVGENPAAVP